MNIKKVAELLGITIDTLRYYERVGVIPPVERDRNGYRLYHDRDLNAVFLAKCLRNAGMSIEAMIEYASLSAMSGTTDVGVAQKEILEEQLNELNQKFTDLEKTRDLLKYKIANYDDHLAKFRSGEMDDDHVDQLWRKAEFKPQDD